MGLVKTRRLAAMHPPSPRLRRTGKQERAIRLRQGFRLRQDYVGQAGGLKAGLKSRQLKVTPPACSLHPQPRTLQSLVVISAANDGA